MQIELRTDDVVWYHGSSVMLSELREGSTITQWRELAEAFSHQPKWLCFEDDGSITYNGKEPGYLFIIDEPVEVGKDIYPNPKTTPLLPPNVEFLTKRPLKVKLIEEL